MPLELRIIMDERGQVSLVGPLENKIICYGMLEVAKEILWEHNKNMVKAASPIELATLGKQS